MNQNDIQLDIEKYLPFFQPDTGVAVGLGLYNQFGRQFIFVDSVAEPSVASDLDALVQAVDWQKMAETGGYQRVPLIGVIYFTALSLGADEQHYWLLGFCPSDKLLSPEQHQKNSAVLQQIAVCLTLDHSSNQTLEGMADELAVRYEELNLLYGMDDLETFYKTYDESHALRYMAMSCTDYLNIDYAAIYLKDQDYFFFQTHWDDSEHSHDLIEATIRQQLFTFMRATAETLVINCNSEKDWTDAQMHLPYKLIMAPISKINQQPSGLFVLLNDISKPDFSNSDRKLVEVLAAEASKLTQARRDVVTGQLNRRGILEQINRLLEAQRASPSSNCFLLLDVDQFKIINDSVGQIGGDTLLRQITVILQKNLKKNDVLGRVGADEFGIILRDCSLEDAVLIADRMRLLIKQFRFLCQGKMFDVSACFSITDLTDDFADFSQVLNAAELSCSIAKDKGLNHFHVYRKTDQLTMKHENMMQWLSRLTIALEENRFVLYRQKIQGLQAYNQAEEHYELLIRLRNENGEVLAPFHFIPAAERFNIMPRIDEWVIKEAFKKIAKAYKDKPNCHAVYAINLSGQSFCEEGFVCFIKNQLKNTDIPSQSICFEITETAAISNLDHALRFIEEIKQLGCSFSLDDFGSGMSSFTYLKNLPVDYLKIDGYFVKNLVENKVDRAMVAAIHQVGSVMGLKTIAEFVENDSILAELELLGIDYGQGYGIGLPEPFV